MASHVVVIATDLRRATVKVTPSTYLIDVLQEACKKLSLDSNKYLMKQVVPSPFVTYMLTNHVRHQNRNVELAVPYRASGLTGGAKLELVVKSKTPSAIQIALQLPQPEAKNIPGGRLIKKFASDMTIWQILRQFESGDANAGRNINITARGVARTSGESGAGQLYFETPVLNIMGRDFSNFTDFQKTMSQLGHNSGSVLIRLTFKMTDKLLFDAMNDIGEYFKDTEAADRATPPAEGGANSTDREKSGTDTPMADALQLEEPLPQPLQTSAVLEAAEASPEVVGSKSENPLEPINVFLAPANNIPAAVHAPQDDMDFTPSIAHAQLHQARLQESSRNRRLPSDKELEQQAAAEEAKIAAITSVRVRVRFPDNTSGDWEINQASTGAFLYDAVRHVMSAKDLPFHLVISGGTTVIKDDASETNRLIKKYKFASRVLVSLVWDDGVAKSLRKQPFLQSTTAIHAQQIRMPELPTYVEEKSELDRPAKEEAKKESRLLDSDGKKKIPKWLKLGKK